MAPNHDLPCRASQSAGVFVGMMPLVLLAGAFGGCEGAETVDATGAIVTPGLIDLHTHVYWGGTSLGVDPDAYALKSASTTLVDAGSFGRVM